MTQTATTRNLAIEGMSGDACINKVRGALKSVPHVTTQSVKVGAATIDADQAGCTAACKAVDAAGYRTKEANAHDKSNTGAAHAGSPDQSRHEAGDKTHASQQPRHEGTVVAPARKVDAVKTEGDRPTAAQRG